MDEGDRKRPAEGSSNFALITGIFIGFVVVAVFVGGLGWVLI